MKQLRFVLAAAASLLAGSASAQGPLWNDAMQGGVEKVVQRTFAASGHAGHEEQGSSRGTDILSYDNAGRLTEKAVSDDPGYSRYRTRMTFVYDGAGRCTERDVWYKGGKLDGKINVKTVFIYDGSGKLSSSETYDDSDNLIVRCLIESRESTWIESEYLIAQEYRGHGSPDEVLYVTHTYDRAGNVISEKEEREGRFYDYKYTYDERGNWIKCIRYVRNTRNSKPRADRILLREISYRVPQ